MKTQEKGTYHANRSLSANRVSSFKSLSIAVVIILLVAGLYFLSRYNYLLFHSFAEGFSIVIGFAIFAIAWNARRFLDNDYLLFVGIAFLFVGIIDFIHTLAYKGMGVFPGIETNTATQLWIAARYLGSLSLLTAPILIRNKLNTILTFSAYAVATGLILASIFYWDNFPAAFIEGSGLTAFKQVSEFIISFILAGAIVLLVKNRRYFNGKVFRFLVTSMVVTIMSEMSFTLYTDAYGVANLFGHVLKIGAFYLIYIALIETGLKNPYELLFRSLKQSEEQYKAFFENSFDAVLLASPRGKIMASNQEAAHMFGMTEKELEHTGRDNLLDRNTLDQLPVWHKGFGTGKFKGEFIFKKKDDSTFPGEISIASFTDRNDQQYTIMIIRDNSEHKKAEELLKQNEEYLRLFVENAPAAIAMFDSQMRYKALSQRWLKDYGITSPDVMGRSHYEVIPGIPERWKETYRRSLTGAIQKAEEDSFQKPDGSTQWLHWEIIPWRKPDRNIGGIIIFSEDITERKKTQESLRHYTSELEIANEELDAANKELESFSYTVSHDLRAPLRSLDGYSCALLDDYAGKLDDQGRQWLNNIRTASQHMGHLIDDILGLSRVIRAELKTARVNLSEKAESIMTKLKETEPERHIETRIMPGVEAVGDSNLLEIVLQNLLENAFKFTRARHPAIIEFGVRLDVGKKVYYVSDNGAGFDMHYVSNLFKPFQRLHSEKEFEGTGIGLVTVHRIIQKHGGEIWVQSEIDKGTIFYFTLAGKSQKHDE